jgi:hypothetical protein
MDVFNPIVRYLVHTRLVNFSKTRITPVLYINTVRSISEMFGENEKCRQRIFFSHSTACTD